MLRSVGICNKQTAGDGFTLIELLVVMSIICVLMAVLLPPLSHSHEMGQRIDCLANLRQLTLGWYFYTADNEGRLCSPHTEWNDPIWGMQTNHWVADGPAIPGNNIGGTSKAIEQGILWPYVEMNLRLYKCKVDRSGLLRSYSLSLVMGGDANMQWCANTGKPFKNFGDLNQISMTSRKLIFVDAASSTGWIDGAFWPVTTQDVNDANWRLSGYNDMTARHQGGCNASFADFHCEYLKWKDPRTVEMLNGTMSASQASDNNPDLEMMVEHLKGP